MKSKIEYKTEDGFGVTIDIEFLENVEGQAKFKATAKVLKVEDMEGQHERDDIGLLISTAMHHLLEMKHHKDIWEVVTENFQITETFLEEPTLGIPNVFGALSTQA